MNIVRKAKIFGETYLAERAGVPLNHLIETKIPVLDQRAPEGYQASLYAVQKDGSLIRTELEQEETAVSDELALRYKMGDAYADFHQQKASSALEDISQHEMRIRDTTDSLQELAGKRSELLENTPDFHYARGESLKNRLIFFLVALGEIGAMFVLFADFFGIDPMRISSETTKHPVAVFSTVFFTIGFFIATLKIAEHVIISNYRWLWFSCLLGIAVLTGTMRAVQANARLETDMNMWFMTLLYTVIGVIFPLAAAYYGKNWEEASQVSKSTDSMQKRLNERAAEHAVRLQEFNQARERSIKRIDQLTSEFVEHYQDAIMKKEKAIRDQDEHRKYVNSYISQLRYAYAFWAGWNARGMSMPKLIKRGMQATALLLLVLIITLSSCHKAHAEGNFHLLTVCDRSSSGGEISCTSETLRDAGAYWLRKADESGGGIFEVFLIDQGFDTTTLMFSSEYPERFPGPVSSHKKKWQNDFLKRLSAETSSLPTHRGSAVVEAIYRASLRIPDRGETLLYILSDLRQQNRDLNFEKIVPTERDFLGWLARNSISPVFKLSTRIMVCGIHPYTPDQTSRMTTGNYDRLIRLWRTVFTQWGVKASITEACSLKTTE